MTPIAVNHRLEQIERPLLKSKRIHLPPEIVLQILGNLPIQEMQKLSELSRTWNFFVRDERSITTILLEKEKSKIKESESQKIDEFKQRLFQSFLKTIEAKKESMRLARLAIGNAKRLNYVKNLFSFIDTMSSKQRVVIGSIVKIVSPLITFSYDTRTNHCECRLNPVVNETLFDPVELEICTEDITIPVGENQFLITREFYPMKKLYLIKVESKEHNAFRVWYVEKGKKRSLHQSLGTLLGNPILLNGKLCIFYLLDYNIPFTGLHKIFRFLTLDLSMEKMKITQIINNVFVQKIASRHSMANL